MEHEEYTLTAADGVAVFGQLWRPSGPLQGVICLVHGHGEHSGRYLHVATTLAEAGYAVLAHDLRGHGRSAGRRGHTPSYAQLLDDVALQLNEGARRFPGVPLCLYGHSLGGNLVLNYALRNYQPRPAAVVATGPWLRLAFTPPSWKRILGQMTNAVWPSFSQRTGLDIWALSRTAGVGEAYRDDPLVHDRMSARLYTTSVAAGQWALAHATELKVPTLLMAGGADRLTASSGSREFAAHAGAICTFRLWGGLYHELHNDPERTQVLAQILIWLQETLAKSRQR